MGEDGCVAAATRTICLNERLREVDDNTRLSDTGALALAEALLENARAMGQISDAGGVHMLAAALAFCRVTDVRIGMAVTPYDMNNHVLPTNAPGAAQEMHQRMIGEVSMAADKGLLRMMVGRLDAARVACVIDCFPAMILVDWERWARLIGFDINKVTAPRHVVVALGKYEMANKRGAYVNGRHGFEVIDTAYPDRIWEVPEADLAGVIDPMFQQWFGIEPNEARLKNELTSRFSEFLIKSYTPYSFFSGGM